MTTHKFLRVKFYLVVVAGEVEGVPPLDHSRVARGVEEGVGQWGLLVVPGTVVGCLLGHCSVECLHTGGETEYSGTSE